MSWSIKIIFYHLVEALSGNITNDVISGMFQIVTTNSMKCFYLVIWNMLTKGTHFQAQVCWFKPILPCLISNVANFRISKFHNVLSRWMLTWNWSVIWGWIFSFSEIRNFSNRISRIENKIFWLVHQIGDNQGTSTTVHVSRVGSISTCLKGLRGKRSISGNKKTSYRLGWSFFFLNEKDERSWWRFNVFNEYSK